MTVAPVDPEAARRGFRTVRELADGWVCPSGRWA